MTGILSSKGEVFQHFVYGAFETYRIGDAFLIGRHDGVKVDQPGRVIGLATFEEWLASVSTPPAPHRLADIRANAKFYRVATD